MTALQGAIGTVAGTAGQARTAPLRNAGTVTIRVVAGLSGHGICAGHAHECIDTFEAGINAAVQVTGVIGQNGCAGLGGQAMAVVAVSGSGYMLLVAVGQ